MPRLLMRNPSDSGWSKTRHPRRARWVNGADVEPAPLAYRVGMVLHPIHRIHLAEARAEELRRDAGRRRRARAGVRSDADAEIVIRPSRPEDERALERLAGLDSAAVPAVPLLVAESNGALRAALSLTDGAVIADPFHRTAPLVELLVARAEQLRGERSTPRRWWSRLRLRTPRARVSGASAPQVEPADS
jgi:hypothetical protein